MNTHSFRLDELVQPLHVSLDGDFRVTGSVVSFVNSSCHLSSFDVHEAHHHLSPVRDFQRYSYRCPVTEIHIHKYIIENQIENYTIFNL